MNETARSFWTIPVDEMMLRLKTIPEGLSSAEARLRLERYGSNFFNGKRKGSAISLFIGQFKSPIILILLLAAGVSFFVHDPTDALIILAIVVISGLLGFWQERGAAHAVEKLLEMVQTRARVLRDKSVTEVPFEGIVPGDIVILSAGASVPGDSLLLESKDLFVDEATLTGETYPVEKTVGVVALETPLSHRTNSLFMGTHVVSGNAKAIVVNTGKETEFGKVAERLKLRPAETEFERGVRRFGYFLMEVTLLLVIAIFGVNVFLKRPVLESFLFSLALAVGLTPQLLPAIISVNLAHGAKRMAQARVIVRRLASIENFGSMDVLCSDKTGTLTEGVVTLSSHVSVDGFESEKVLLYAYLNAFYETGFLNPIDQAIRTHGSFDVTGYHKLDEVPYDFVRKRLSILVSDGTRRLLITKGALENVLAVCEKAELASGAVVSVREILQDVTAHYQKFSNQGFRTLGLAYREIDTDSTITKMDESRMTFLGLIVFSDRLKPGIAGTISDLSAQGVSLKIITGDNRLVAATTSEAVGLSALEFLTGTELREMSDEALLQRVGAVNVFAEVEPNQKERIIHALRKAGAVVGYMGDGINDASALHAADVGISVDSAVDVAKEAADIVLLEKDLSVLVQGVAEGRKTFTNTLKYVFMATSAN